MSEIVIKLGENEQIEDVIFLGEMQNVRIRFQDTDQLKTATNKEN